VEIPIDILKKCDSYAYCADCNEAMKLAKAEKLVKTSVHSIQPSSEHCQLTTKISFSPETNLTARQSSKRLMQELLKKHSQDSARAPQIPSGEVLPFHSCPSVNVCLECAQLYQVNDAPSAHLPLCLSVDLCHSCASSRKHTEVDAKSSFNTILSEVSCFSYNDCKDCRMARDMKKLKSKAKHADAAAHSIPRRPFLAPPILIPLIRFSLSSLQTFPTSNAMRNSGKALGR
jgi:hypothetical protein